MRAKFLPTCFLIKFFSIYNRQSIKFNGTRDIGYLILMIKISNL